MVVGLEKVLAMLGKAGQSTGCRLVPVSRFPFCPDPQGMVFTKETWVLRLGLITSSGC